LFLGGIRSILKYIPGYKCHPFWMNNQILVVVEVDVQLLDRMVQFVVVVVLEVVLAFVLHS
jgi:hypothetical protein